MFVFFVFTSKIYVIHKEEHLVTYFRIGLQINILNFTILNISSFFCPLPIISRMYFLSREIM